MTSHEASVAAEQDGDQLRWRPNKADFAAARKVAEKASPTYLEQASKLLPNRDLIRTTGSQYYRVAIDPKAHVDHVDVSRTPWGCTCQYVEGAAPCLHIVLVARWIMGRDPTNYDHLRKPRPAREWKAYNQAAKLEWRYMPQLMGLAAATIPTDPRIGPGRPQTPNSDCAFASLARFWLRKGLRQLQGTLRDPRFRVHITKPPSLNASSKWLNQPEATGHLRHLLHWSARHLALKETAFGIDATGIAMQDVSTYYEDKVNAHLLARPKRFVMVSIAAGHKTHAIADAEVWTRELTFEARQWMGDAPRNESPYFRVLAPRAKQVFPFATIVTGDAAYGGRANHLVAEALNLKAYLQPKNRERHEHAVTNDHFDCISMSVSEPAKYSALAGPHQNVEATNHMIKAHMGREVVGKGFRTITNEIYCKLIVHNLRQCIRFGFAPSMICQPLSVVSDYAGSTALPPP